MKSLIKSFRKILPLCSLLWYCPLASKAIMIGLNMLSSPFLLFIYFQNKIYEYISFYYFYCILILTFDNVLYVFISKSYLPNAIISRLFCIDMPCRVYRLAHILFFFEYIKTWATCLIFDLCFMFFFGYIHRMYYECPPLTYRNLYIFYMPLLNVIQSVFFFNIYESKWRTSNWNWIVISFYIRDRIDVNNVSTNRNAVSQFKDFWRYIDWQLTQDLWIGHWYLKARWSYD